MAQQEQNEQQETKQSPPLKPNDAHFVLHTQKISNIIEIVKKKSNSWFIPLFALSRYCLHFVW